MSSRDRQKLSVPKFGSFKQKPEPTQPKVEVEDGQPTSSKHIVKQNARKSVFQGHTNGPSVADTSRRQGEQADQDGRATGRGFEVSRRPAPAEAARDTSFMFDRRGDALIRRYGNNNRYDIPKYRRFGSGRILGADGYLRVEQAGNREEFFIRGFHEGGSALKNDRKSILAKARRNKSQPVRLRTEESAAPMWTDDFLPFKQSKKRKRKGSQSGESSGEEGPAYRSISGKSKLHEHSDSDEVYSSDSSSSSSGQRRTDDPVTVKGIELSARVRSHPQDVDAWLELADHQDRLLRLNDDDGHQVTQAEIKSQADVKLSILEKALAQVALPRHREKLLLRIMREGSKIWERKTMHKRWEDLMKEHGSSFEIWNAYVAFRQANLSTFRYDDVKELYIDRLKKIGNQLAGEAITGPELHDLCDEFVVVFLKATRFVADAGFVELAVAAWQATLEINFCRPPELMNSPKTTLISSFQNFWESEVPRIGEESARGWAGFEASGGTDLAPEPKSFDAGVAPSTRDPYRAWATAEQKGVANARTPARTMDAGAEDDPYRVVMYADLQDLVLYVTAQNLAMVQPQLLDAFLAFRQLLPAFGTSEPGQGILKGEFLHGGSNHPFRIDETSRQDETTEEADNKTKRSLNFGHDYPNMTRTLQELFPPKQWFKYLRPVREETGPDQYKLISNVLKQLSLLHGFKELASYHLAFEGLDQESAIKKLAKAALKQYPTATELYTGYASLESARGNNTMAENILSAALSLPSVPAEERLRLCINWALIVLEDGDLSNSASRLDIIAEGSTGVETTTPAQNLKTKHLLTSSRDYLLSTGGVNNAIVWAEALALLEYLTRNSGSESQSTGQGDIASAMMSISSFSKELAARGLDKNSAHERLLQFAARLLFFHASHGPFRPAFFREQLTKYIQLFPQNTIFLHLYAWREARLSIDDRVRSILDKHVLVAPHDCASSRVFAIRHEAKTGNSHSTRAAFEHALASDTCRNHTGIWISYIRFCYEKNELRPKAKDVFYRAIQNCPWSKDVFMEAFVTLVREMDSAELKSVYNTLCEKGLRVHVEMDEFVENWRKTQKQRPVGGR